MTSASLATRTGEAGTGATGFRLRQRYDGATLPVAVAGVVSAALSAVVLLLPPTGTDLAAQVARADFWSAHGAALVDLRWYGGVHPAAYSVLAPALMASLGVRLAGAVATVAGAVGLAVLLTRIRGVRPVAGATWGALALVANLVSGRVTFGLGTAAGLAAVLALTPHPPTPTRRLLLAGLLAVLTSLLSPVAGLFLALAAVALAIAGRRGDGLCLLLGAAVPLLALQAAFPDGGRMPFAWRVAWPPLVAGVVIAGVRAVGRPVRVGAALYAGGVLAAFLLPTPLGSNVERLSLIFAGPVVLAAARWPRTVLVPVLALTAYWQAAPGIADLRYGGDPAADPAYSAGLVAELHRLGAQTGRVEVVPQRNHWESVMVARDFWLARGWERQVDVARNPIFYRDQLEPAAYHSWLQGTGVGYVALADVAVDWSATQEAALVGGGQPWLRPVWADAHWRLWRVLDPSPLVGAPGRVLATRADGLTVAMPSAASVLLRLRWSPWLAIRGPAGCLAPSGDWVTLRASAPGTYLIGAGVGSVAAGSRACS